MATKKKSTAKITPQASATALGDLLEHMSRTLTANASDVQADPLQGNSDVLVSQWQKQFAGEDIAALALGIRVRRVAMLIDELLLKECEAAGIRLNEMLLLMALRRVGPPYAMRPTDILKMHSITSGTVTYRIDQLTKQDLAERIDDPGDRRGYLIRVTPHGLKIVESILHRLVAVFRSHLQPMAAIPGALPMFEESLRLYERCISGS
ncbi:MAG: MarR family transcriptional regulator [Hydrogenophaga sp.]|uniref:MarR family winged helix-turn-helix transcriptional regulator n=1 Tax=Hydrogenophaga sp. TaxID=1904254 RepID=UPI0025C197C4|nr:MarR family transcriptional regulator [Hydrogenophaga sp.]MBT9554013.1 MarR family transcriptional regulator [Hydrogenophaga sp.]